MRKLVVFMTIIIVLAACAPTVRYSLSELEQYSPQTQEHIKRGEIVLGMTFQQVRYAWGAPNKVIVKGADDKGRFIEEWIYAKYRVVGKRAVFADGQLIQAYTRVTRSDVRDDRIKKPASNREAEPPGTSDGMQPSEGEEIQE